MLTATRYCICVSVREDVPLLYDNLRIFLFHHAEIRVYGYEVYEETRPIVCGAMILTPLFLFFWGGSSSKECKNTYNTLVMHKTCIS